MGRCGVDPLPFKDLIYSQATRGRWLYLPMILVDGARIELALGLRVKQVPPQSATRPSSTGLVPVPLAQRSDQFPLLCYITATDITNKSERCADM